MNIPNGIAYLENPANILRGIVDTFTGFINKDSETSLPELEFDLCQLYDFGQIIYPSCASVSSSAER